MARHGTQYEVLKNATCLELRLCYFQLNSDGVAILFKIKDDRIPKVVFCGQLKEDSRTAGGQKLRFKDTVKSNLKSCNIDVSNWE